MSPSRHLRAAGLAIAAALATALAGAAEAHAHLMTSSPAANATGPAPSKIELRFSEAPMARFSGAQLMAGGRVVPVKMVASDAKDVLVVAPAAPLKAGAYTVKWHAVTADTHRTQGAFTFKVR